MARTLCLLDGENFWIDDSLLKTVSKYPQRGRSAVTGIVLHQTDTTDSHNWNSSQNLKKRPIRDKAHFIVLRTGDIYQFHPITTRLSAANSLNDSTVSIEFAGEFLALNRTPRVSRPDNHIWGRKKTRKEPRVKEKHKLPVQYLFPSRNQVLAGRALVKYLHDTYSINNIYAHTHAYRHPKKRSKPSQKRHCCGIFIWQNVGLWATSNLGMSVDRTLCTSPGIPCAEGYFENNPEYIRYERRRKKSSNHYFPPFLDRNLDNKPDTNRRIIFNYEGKTYSCDVLIRNFRSNTVSNDNAMQEFQCTEVN